VEEYLRRGIAKMINYPKCPHCGEGLNKVELTREAVFSVREYYYPKPENEDDYPGWVDFEVIDDTFCEYTTLLGVQCPHCMEHLSGFDNVEDVEKFYKKDENL
jgi:hypothetical protein